VNLKKNRSKFKKKNIKISYPPMRISLLRGAVYEQALNNYLMTAIGENVRGTSE
jgi:hypothetical protein